MRGGWFPLAKVWSSNCLEVLLSDQSATIKDTVTIEIEPTHLKILGLVWQPDSDTFHFLSQPSAKVKITKRALAFEIAKLYDPLGLISPILIRAKIILQELWLIKISWDDHLPLDIRNRWLAFREQLKELTQLSIPRWLGIIRSESYVEIHGFSDASHLAMSAVEYIRIHNKNDKFSVRLICSKTKVARLKRLTILRLELTAALILARLVAHTVKILEIPNASNFLWTDSSVTLTWITAYPSRWKDFVRNCVSAIQEVLPTGLWCFVPGKDNPADCATRELRPDQLQNHELWWTSSKWLSESENSWPATEERLIPDADLEERPGQTLFAFTQSFSYWQLLDKYSSLTRLLRITAICRRFISRLRNIHNSSLSHPLTPADIEQNHLFWVRIVQNTWFPNEIRIISRGEKLPRFNPLIRFTPFIDRQGILRVGGRLHNAQIDPESKHPIILPRRSPFTTLFIDDAHRRTLHGGVPK